MPLISQASSNSSFLADTPTLPLHVVTVISWIWVSIAWAVVLLRLMLRYQRFHKFHSDDWAVVAATLCSVGLLISWSITSPKWVIIDKAAHGEMPYPPNFFDVLSSYYKLSFASAILFWSTLWAVKVSFLLFFRRLSGKERRHEIFWRCVMAFTIVTYCGSVITEPIYCSSFDYVKCASASGYYKATLALKVTTVLDIVSDLLIIAVPVHLLRKVQLPPRKKWGLLGLLCGGFIIIIIAIVRIAVLSLNEKFPNPVWLSFWTVIEVGAALIVCCLSSFRNLFSRNNATTYGSPSNPTVSRSFRPSRTLISNPFHQHSWLGTSSDRGAVREIERPLPTYVRPHEGQTIMSISSPLSSTKKPSLAEGMSSDEDLFRGEALTPKM